MRLLVSALRNPPSGVRAIRVVREYRRALETLRARAVSGDLEFEQLQLAAERAGVTSAEAGRIVDEWFVAKPLKLLPGCACEGLPEFLNSVSFRSVRMAAVSDYEPAGKLQALGIARHFDVIVTPRTTGFLKPHPSALQKALDLLEVDRDRALYIGDRLDVDVPAARRVGIRCAIFGKHSKGISAGFVQFPSYSGLMAILDPYLASGT